ncbi:protein of unknown function [Denitratisoma oestradiolicum]|uniref:Uncharacterized protein n=1 Tax=Denitratisoma oestradiolicum TaxID=311182 RepID=A0A6S6XPE0_9PROT|nr:protein of unknown function [Denitratisoma oestradiolicum]
MPPSGRPPKPGTMGNSAGDAHGPQEFFPQDFIGVDVGQFFHDDPPSVVIDNFNRCRAAGVPDEADASFCLDFLDLRIATLARRDPAPEQSFGCALPGSG